MRTYFLLMTLTLAAAACGDSSPTAPVVQPTAAPRVAGTWSGTVKSLEVVDPWDVGPVCQNQHVTVELTQGDGSESRFLHGTVQAACITAQFGGTLVGDLGQTIQGKLAFEAGGVSYFATLNGTLEGSPVSRISAQTSVFTWSSSDGSSRRSDSIQLELSR